MKGFRRGRAAVVVLGDVGRSPRMCAHALALAQEAGLEVDLIGYPGTQPHADILCNEKIHVHTLAPPFTNRPPRALYLLSLPFKVVIQICTLLWVLCVSIPAPDLFILQNPPSIPTLTIAQFACWLRGSFLVIDWHNFGYTLLGLTLGPSHPLVKIHRWYERRFGKNAAAHFCVTQAMQHELQQNWGIRATVLYDKPANHFQPTQLVEKHKLFLRLNKALTTPLGEWDCCTTPLGTSSHLPGEGQEEQDKEATESPSDKLERRDVTLVTFQSGNGKGNSSSNEIHLREDRPAIIISSTSWTPDEDFGILLGAAEIYDRRVSGEEEGKGEKRARSAEAGNSNTFGGSYPRLLLIITGKGPQKALYEEKIAKLRFKRVAFRTLWLEAEDYPRLLGSADLGVSLHASSSGLDLPMKVADMFGCGLPVAAAAYSCIGELIKEGENGVTFSTREELAQILLDLFHGFPSTGPVLSKLKGGSMAEARGVRWLDLWRTTALRLLVHVAEASTKQKG